jgi:hypothetical protein
MAIENTMHFRFRYKQSSSHTIGKEKKIKEYEKEQGIY